MVQEPVEEWKRVGILQEFYNNPKAHAYDFQTYTFVTRVKETIQQVEAHPDATIFLLERSVLTVRLASPPYNRIVLDLVCTLCLLTHNHRIPVIRGLTSVPLAPPPPP